MQFPFLLKYHLAFDVKQSSNNKKVKRTVCFFGVIVKHITSRRLFEKEKISCNIFFTKTERWRLFLFNPLVYSWTINFMLRIKITHFVGNKYEAASPNGQKSKPVCI